MSTAVKTKHEVTVKGRTSHHGGGKFPTGDQWAEFHRQVEAGLWPPERMDEALIMASHPPSFDRARHLLVDEFLPAEEIIGALSMLYAKSGLEELSSAFPGKVVVDRCKESNLILVAGPPEDLTLADIARKFPNFLNSQDIAKIANEKFFGQEVVRKGWLAIGRGPLFQSTFKPLREQINLLGRGWRVPNVPEIVWATLAYLNLRGRQLLSGQRVRSSSVNAKGQYICVGPISTDLKLGISSDFPNEKAYGYLGLAYALRF
ncbi:MAG: hypothetical protein Q8P32_04920 [Candidatus Komeilibacteria bacterium]|nr:hypothetical protein [Candidatus Komeilibacteria bacterium]